MMQMASLQGARWRGAMALALLLAAPVPALAQAESAAPADPAAPVIETPAETRADTPERVGADPIPVQVPAAARPAARTAWDNAARVLRDGGPAIWVIAVLSVVTVAVILWKTWRLALIGAWSPGRARVAVAAFEAGQTAHARDAVAGRRGLRSRVVLAAITARGSMSESAAREETERVARRELAEAASGLRILELIATIAPLIGLLGTVLGMIAAFQALQDSGARADPAVLAGGIWEALLTTAAGMIVAIPAAAVLTWFESVIDRMRRDVEDAATRIFIAPAPMLRAAQ